MTSRGPKPESVTATERARAAIDIYLDVGQGAWSDEARLERALIDARLSLEEAAELLVEQGKLGQPHEHIIADAIVAALLHERMPAVYEAYGARRSERWYA